MFKKLLLLCSIISPIMTIEIDTPESDSSELRSHAPEARDPEKYFKKIQTETGVDEKTLSNAISQWKRRGRKSFPSNDLEAIKSMAQEWKKYIARTQITRANKAISSTLSSAVNKSTTPLQRDRAHQYWLNHRTLTKPTTIELIKQYAERQHTYLYKKRKKQCILGKDVEQASPELMMPDIFIQQPDTPPSPTLSPEQLPYLLPQTSPYLKPNSPPSSPSVPPLELEPPLGENW